MLPENPSFFIRGDDGLEYGPVDLEELRDWVRENRAGLGTNVRRDEPGEIWLPWQSFPELVALLAEVTATASLPGLVLAPMGRRVLAFGLDIILVSFLVTPLFIVLAFVYLPDWLTIYVQAAAHPPFTPPELPRSAEVYANLICDLALAFYFALFHAAHARTPAKSIFRVRVVDQAGQKPDLARSMWRALLLIFSMSFFFLPLAYAFFNPQRRALHDIIAGTYVVEA